MMAKLTVLGVTLGLCLAAAPAEAKKPKVLVQDLKAQGVEAHEAMVLSTAACTAFSKSTKHDVLCGDDLRNMMQFGALAATFDGCAEENCYASMGKALSARYIVSGSVSKLGASYVLSIAMFDTEEGRPAGRTQIKADTVEKLHRDAGEAVSAILSKKRS